MRKAFDLKGTMANSTDFAKWFVYMMGGEQGTVIFDKLEKLFVTLKSFYHPSNYDKHSVSWWISTYKFFSLLADFMFSFSLFSQPSPARTIMYIPVNEHTLKVLDNVPKIYFRKISSQNICLGYNYIHIHVESTIWTTTLLYKVRKYIEHRFVAWLKVVDHSSTPCPQGDTPKIFLEITGDWNFLKFQGVPSTSGGTKMSTIGSLG